MKFVDGVDRNILRGRTNRLVTDIQAIDLNTRRAAKSSAKGDRRKALFGRIEVAAVLNLHSGFELSEVQEIAAVDGQVLNLLLRNHALNRGLFRIQRDGGTLNANHRSCTADFHADGTCGDVANLDGGRELRGFEPGRLHPHYVLTRNQSPGIVRTRWRHVGLKLLSCGFAVDAHLS